MICAMVKNAPLFAGFDALFDIKKCPPDLLLALGLVR